jgi:hypothetical protein
VRALDLLRHRADDNGAGSVRELGKLSEMIVSDAAGTRPFERDADEQRTLHWQLDVDRNAAYVRNLK